MKPAQFLKKLNDFQFWIKFVNFLYLLLVFTFVVCEKEKYSYLEQQEYCRPLCGNKTISPEVRQKSSCLWCGKTFLSVVRQKLSCLWCGKSPLACGAAKALLPVVRQRLLACGAAKPSCLWCGLRQKLSCLWCGLRHEPPLGRADPFALTMFSLGYELWVPIPISLLI